MPVPQLLRFHRSKEKKLYCVHSQTLLRMFKVIALRSLQNNDGHKRIALDKIMSILSRKDIQGGRLFKDPMLDVSSYDML